jgi:hypothetical protein
MTYATNNWVIIALDAKETLKAFLAFITLGIICFVACVVTQLYMWWVTSTFWFSISIQIYPWLITMFTGVIIACALLWLIEQGCIILFGSTVIQLSSFDYVSKIRELYDSNYVDGCMIKISHSEIQGDCSICRESLSAGVEAVVRLNHCQHQYHINCINTWLNEHSTCPLCRNELNQNESGDYIVKKRINEV